MLSTMLHASEGSNSAASAINSSMRSLKGLVGMAASVGVAVLMRCRKRRGKGKERGAKTAAVRSDTPTAAASSPSDSDESEGESLCSPQSVESIDSIPSVISAAAAPASRSAETNNIIRKLRVCSDCVVIVDPLSTGANVADAILRAGFLCVIVTTGQIMHEGSVQPELRSDYLETIPFDSFNPDATVNALRALPVRLVAVMAGSELGVEACDLLSERLGLPSNGTQLSEARRDKSIMQDTIRRAGLKSIAQVRAECWADVVSFLDWDRMPLVVLKPARSAGSDSVFKCSSESQARAAFESIMSAPCNALGQANRAVVAQQFLAGPEFIVDSVSFRGQHKIVAIYQYDKRSFQGHDFIYFGQSCCSGLESPGRELAAYALRVLEALQVREGAAHAEIILTEQGPTLVEVGCRPQGNDGTFMPLADRVWGYNQVSVLVSALRASLGCPADWEAIPSLCSGGFARGFKLDFVCAREGVLRRIAHLHRMERLQSFLRFDLLPSVGSRLAQTIDCFTACGSVSLCHRSEQILQADMQRVREWEKTMWVMQEDAIEGSGAKEEKKMGDPPTTTRRAPHGSAVGEEQAASALEHAQA